MLLLYGMYKFDGETSQNLVTSQACQKLVVKHDLMDFPNTIRTKILLITKA